MGAAVLKAALRAVQVIAAVLRDLIENDGKTLATIAVGVISVFIALLIMVIIPVVIHERVPVCTTKEQAVWYWQAAKSVTEMTQSPCDPGVYVDWQNVIAIDAVRLKQNFNKSSLERAYELALRFVEETGTCTH
jgi:D-alanyl-lipoteichoic acid acyltransferase DltB (MBOAT superfamily)